MTSPSATASPPASPSLVPSQSPGSTIPQTILDHVIVIGEASYSPSGRWFAFSARPSDGSDGPDVYIWRVGEASAQAMTSDHASVFSTWIGEQLLGSRATAPTGEPEPLASESPDTTASGEPASSDAGTERQPETFLLDPESGRERLLKGASLWRPVVDPKDRLAVYWSGSIELGSNGVDWKPAVGELVLAAWDPSRVAAAASSLERNASAGPTTSTSGAPPDSTPSGLPGTSPTPVASTPIPLTTGPVSDWDVGWDESGTHFALWIADPIDPAAGALSLYAVDPTTGRVRSDPSLPRDVRALSGFALGNGRVAWATPPGQNGEGSHVSLFAWTGEGAGRIESLPASGQSPVIIVQGGIH